jgi:hypothetical protein
MTGKNKKHICRLYKKIDGFDDYVVCSDGTVISKKFGKVRILKSTPNKWGYHHVNLTINGKQYKRAVHLLVAKAFLNHDTSRKIVVDHIDNDKNNNAIENLQIITQRENSVKDRSKNVGTYLHKPSGKYQAKINIDGKNKSLGYYDTQDEAKIAYQNALKQLI